MKIKINDLFYKGQYQANMKVSTFFNPFMWGHQTNMKVSTLIRLCGA